MFGRATVTLVSAYIPFCLNYDRRMEKGRPLYFCRVISSSLCLLLFSLPNLSGRRVDVYHTSTRGVA